MIPVYYDLHIHSALSPCAGNDMTPNDILGMAILNGLDLIAITDHNSFSNAIATVKAASAAKETAENLPIVLPGIEVSTIEEVHVICLLDSIEAALSFESELNPFYSLIPNRIDVFGNQIFYDEKDNKTGEEERMLIAPTTISFDDLYFLVNKHNGAFIPAHVDRDSFSVMSNLGFLPPHLEINTVEVSLIGLERDYPSQNAAKFSKSKMIYSSDAHELWSINERLNHIMLPERTARAAIDFLR